MRSLAVSLCIALLALGSASAEGETLRLGTWNIEWFGCRQVPRSTAQIEQLAEFIRELDLDVLAVEEIGGEAALGRLAQRLGPNYGYVLGTTGGSAGAGPGQSVGFVWDSAKVELLRVEELHTLPKQHGDYHLFNRVPVAASFRARNGGLDFRAVAIHMKAIKRHIPNHDDKKGKTIQAAEAQELAKLVRHVLTKPGEDPDLVFLGDFNHFRGERSHEILRQALHYVEPPQPQQTIVHFETQIDHLALSPSLRERLVPGSARVHNARMLKDKTTWLETFSDHCPVTVEFDASKDRDPDARLAPLTLDHELQAKHTQDGVAAGAPTVSDTAGLVGAVGQPLTVAASSPTGGATDELNALLRKTLGAVKHGKPEAKALVSALRPDSEALQATVADGHGPLKNHINKHGNRFGKAINKLAHKGGELRIDVQVATTEELRGMLPGSAASEHFPAGLQGLATDALLPERTFYYARFFNKAGEVRNLMLFTRTADGYACLGKPWLAPRN